MPFVNKEIQLREFLERVHQRIKAGGNGEALGLFKIYVMGGLIRRLQELNPSWVGRVAAGNFDVLYPMAVEILHDAAATNYSECHPDIYKNADVVSEAFCAELNEFFECSGEHVFQRVAIVSYVEMMQAAGLIEVQNGVVQETPLGVAVAEEVQRQIDENNK